MEVIEDETVECTNKNKNSVRSVHHALLNDKGIALVIVLVLSAIGLALMTTLIYLITTGVQVSGLQKRYKSALEAGMGGKDIVLQVISMKDKPPSEITNFVTALNTAGATATITTPDTCTGTYRGSTLVGFQAKLKALASAGTATYCKSLTIDTANPNTYDMKFELGTNPRYNVYAKIVDTIPGSEVGASTNLRGAGVDSSTEGVIQVAGIPNLYTIEIHTQNAAKPEEKAKLQILYQY